MKETLLTIKKEIENLLVGDSLTLEDKNEYFNILNDIVSAIRIKQSELEEDFFIVNKVEENLVIIHATSYRNPNEQVKRIEERLKDFNGIIVYDFLLCNGTCNRLFETKVEKNSPIKLKGNFKHLSDEIAFKLTLKNYLNDFYNNNIDLLSNGILSQSEIIEIKTQIEKKIQN